MKNVLLTITILGLMGCQPITESAFLIQNDSSHTVVIKGDLIFNNTDSSLTMEPNTQAPAQQWTQRGKVLGSVVPTEIIGEEVSFITLDGDTLTKDYKEESNWEFKTTSSGRVTSHSYTFYMTDDDF